MPFARATLRTILAERCRFPASSFVASMRRQKGGLIHKETKKMRVMVFAKATEASATDGPPSPEALEAFAAMDRFIEELVKAGVFVAGAGLKNGAEAKRIVLDGTRRTVIDGPFAETRELIAGFSIWEVKDMDEALAWAKRAPNPAPGRYEMEIRPFYEAADLAEYVSPED